MLILVRHGRTAANAAALLQGRSDHPLDDLGESQAAALGRELGRSVARVLASPLTRAQQTAAAIAAPGALDVETDERWYELDYGGLEGAPIAEVPASTWASWRSDPDFVPAGGESHADLFERVRLACEELVALPDDIAVVSHVGPIKAALAWVFGLDPSSGWRCHLDHASITRISKGAHGPVLRSFNETQHLRAF